MSVSFSKIKNISLKERVIRELEKKILSGELQPGDRLPPEREIASTMDISRSLINLCVLELEARGFVRIVPRQGTFINDYKKQGTPQILMSLMNYDSDKMDLPLFDSLMDTRRLIEYECVRLAVKNADAEDFRKMQDALASMQHKDCFEGFIKGNFRFHHTLIAASGNAIYSMIFNSFEYIIRYFLKLFICNEERRQVSAGYHQELYDALCIRDEARALAAMKRTLDTGVAGLSSIYKQKKE